MKIDLHNHTTLSSACSILKVEELIEHSMRLGLDGICVTEHNTMRGGKIAEDIGRERGFLVIAGQEVASSAGDILAFGLDEENLDGIPINELCHLAFERDAILIPAHPFRAYSNAIGKSIFFYTKFFSAVEVFNGNCNPEEIKQAQQAATEMKLPGVGGSDAHSTRQVGRYYTLFEEGVAISDRRSLVQALRGGKYKPAVNPLWKPQ